MIVVDVNILIYAYNRDSVHHQKAANWWSSVVNSGTSPGVPWPVFQAFLRLLSARGAVKEPYTLEELFRIAQEWWDHGVLLLSPSAASFSIFRSLCEKYSAVGSASTDTFIATFALEHRARLATNDTDFLRYTELKTFNPLV